MGLKVKGGSDSAVDVDMTPMIDIVFQLITFFMVVINFEAAETDERVKMASSMLARPPIGASEDLLVLQMGYDRKDGQIVGSREEPSVFYAGDKVPVQSMGPRLDREILIYKRKNPGAGNEIKTTVVIRADAECPAGKVQELIQICQSKQYTKFSLKAESKADDAK